MEGLRQRKASTLGQQIAQKVKNFDINPKISKDSEELVVRKTYGGAVLSVMVGLISLWLILAELNYYWSPVRQTEILMDGGIVPHFQVEHYTGCFT